MARTGRPTGLRVAFVGLGGAGQRHARILRGLLGEDPRWCGVRRRGSTPVLDAEFKPQQTSMADAYGIDTVPTLAAALAAGVDLVVVATPTALHVEAVAEALRAGTPVLVEKPLALTRVEAEQLATLATANGVGLFVGFQRRFHPAWHTTTRMLADAELGELTAASFWAHSNVAAWHPYEPLSSLYAVRQDLGGGVIRTECHELDLALGLFGAPDDVRATGVLPTEPNAVELSAELVLTYPDTCPVELSVSLTADVPARGWRLTGSRGQLSWDEGTGELVVESAGKVQRRTLDGFGNDDLVATQDRWMLAQLADPDSVATAAGLAQSVLTSTVIDAAYRALAAPTE